ncbi:tetraspanin-6-like [Sphaerodactylus townsendi]|uniref:tetraspanin-6-like n=1 Tax=Sphaerodactylus townsendi TaxID=933632 RepID=UPI002025DDF6|nr:tetraspanin-6-like [Sphaerodactylus townsendi]
MKTKSSNKERLIKMGLWLIISLCWISGVVLMCIGVSVQVKIHDTFMVVNERASGVPVIIMTFGTIIILISTFGAVALLKQNPKMIKAFIGMLLTVLLVETVVVASAYSYRKKLHQTLLRNFLETLNKYNVDLPVTKALDSLQRQFQCCGAEKYTDWLNTTFGSLSPSVPTSCCKLDVKSCVTDLSKAGPTINQQGCVHKLQSWIEEHMMIFGGIGIFIGLTQLTGILLSYMLLRMLKENYESLQ